MLIRIGFIVAIVASLAVVGLNLTKVKDTINGLKQSLASETDAKNTALAAQSKAEKAQKVAEKDLADTKTELADTQGKLEKTTTEAETQTKRANKLSEDLTKSKQETSDAQAQMAAYTAIGLKPEQITHMRDDLKAANENNGVLTDANKELSFKVAMLTNRIAKYEDPDNYRVQLPSGLHGKVLVADPKWDFVVLDFGAKQGALEDGVLLVNRNGRLVAKVQIRNVQQDRCIANVLPNWKLGDVMEGDVVIP